MKNNVRNAVDEAWPNWAEGQQAISTLSRLTDQKGLCAKGGCHGSVRLERTLAKRLYRSLMH